MARKQKVPIEVGASYTYAHPGGRGEVDYAVMAEVMAETVRFKWKVDGYQLLILDVRGVNPWELKPGQTLDIPRGGCIMQRLARL